MKRNLTIYFLIIILFTFSSCGVEKGKIFQTFSKNIDANNLIRIKAYHENCFGSVCGAFYVVESVNRNNNSSTDVLTFRHDDPLKFPEQNIIVENNNLAYFWMHKFFGKTMDGGEHWEVINIDEESEIKNIVSQSLIEKVEIDETGKGKMFLKSYGNDRNQVLFLTTKDFGKTWQKP